jgi:hypothetical protein
MPSVSLKHFLATGRFGPVALGADRIALEWVFGAPETTGGTGRRKRVPPIWKYGDVRFFFDPASGRLNRIHIDTFSGAEGEPQGWGLVELDPWIVRQALPRDVFERELGAAGIAFNVVARPRVNQHVIELRSGVEVGFFSAPDDSSNLVGLTSLSRSERSDAGPE